MVRIFILFILCLTFSSCDEVPQLSAISKVSTSFNTGSTFYDGGIFVVGVRTDVEDKVSYSSANGIIPEITIDRGDWTFYGVGYIGPQRMKGNLECGMTSVSIRGGKSSKINIAMSAEGCSGKLARTIKIHSVQVDRCDGFYIYDSNVDQFNTFADYFAGSTCINLPADQKAITDSPYYRIEFINRVNGVETAGVKSSCRLYNLAADRIRLPIAIFPYKISLYRSLETCNSTLAAHNEFKMNNGIEAGNPAEYDHFVKQIQADKTDTRIVVPSAHTRRWKSPFMSMLPRMMCDTKLDCFTTPSAITPDPNPYPSAYTGLTLWDIPKKNQLLMTDVKATSCEDLTYDSKYFVISDCKIKNRFLYGTVTRNQLSCRPSVAPAFTYYDLYERNGKVYMLYLEFGSAIVRVIDKKGVIIGTYSVPDNTVREVAANDNGEIFVSSPTNGTKSYIPLTASTLNLNFNEPSIMGSELEVNADGSILYFSDAPNGTVVKSYDVANHALMDTYSFTQIVRKIQFYSPENAIYVHSVDAPNTAATGTVHKVDVTPGVLGSPELVTSGTFSISFHIYGDRMFIYGIGDGPGNVISSMKNASGVWTVINGLSGNSFLSNTGDKFIAIDRGVYTIDVGTNTIVSSIFKFYGEWDRTVDTGLCRDAFTLRLGDQNSQVSFVTQEASGTTINNHILFDAALSAVGVRQNFREFNRYLFNNLNKNQTKETLSGKLSLAQRLLGPQGVGGMLHEYSTCESLRTIAAISPVEKNYPVSDPYSGYRSYQIEVTAANYSIPSFSCNDTTINGACTETYDLNIAVRSTGLLEKENYNLRLKCGSKKGELDYLRYDAEEIDKQLHIWNTNIEAASRSDSYELFKRRAEFRSEMTYVTKSNEDSIRSRSVVLEYWNDLRTSYTLDYERDAIDHRVRVKYFSGSPLTFSSLPSYAASRNLTQFSGTAPVCRPVLQSSLDGVTTTCAMSAQSATNSKGFDLSIATLENSDVSGVPFQNLFQTAP